MSDHDAISDRHDAPIDAIPEAPLPPDESAAATPSNESVSVRGSDNARLVAGVILEVLGGVRTPTEAAEVLGVATARYYHLESRAVAGLVAACEPRPRGPQVDYAVKWQRASAEIAALTQEVGRLTALLRAAQQAYGVKPMPADRTRQAKAAKKAGRRAKRRPGVRALKARDRLDGSSPDDAASDGTGSAPS